MATRSGGTPIKNVRKVKPGPDQAFTLQKGTSAAPIMQVKITKNEKSFLNQRLKKKAVDGGEMKESIPSLSVRGNNMTIKNKDIKKFDKFFDVSKPTETFGGKVPPRILSGKIINKLE